MKICFISFGRPSRSYGVAKKILAQAEALKQAKVSVMVIFMSIHGLDKDQCLEGDYTHLFLERPGTVPLLSKITNRRVLISKLEKYLNGQEYDLLYMRYPPYVDGAMVNFAKRHPNLITENNSKELQEKQLNGNYLTWMLERIYGSRFLQNVLAVVAVTNEIAAYENNRAGKMLKTYVVQNGISVKDMPVRSIPAFDHHNLNILFVAKIYPHHGLDRLIKGLSNYRGELNICLHVVGDGPALPGIKRLVNNLKLQHHVKFYGRLAGKELDVMYDKCHLAVGTLGIHRNGMQEGATLKVREYISRGIPFFLSYWDDDLDNESIKPYVLKLPEGEDAIDVSSVLKFASKITTEPEHAIIMRKYALQHVDMSVKMNKLKTVFETCLNEE